MPKGLGEGRCRGKALLPRSVRSIGDHAIEFATAELGVSVEECDWETLAQAAADHVAKCRQSLPDMPYKDMNQLNKLSQFALRFLAPEGDPNNNHADLLAWQANRTAASSSSEESEEEDEGREEAASIVSPQQASTKSACGVVLGMAGLVNTGPSDDQLESILSAVEDGGGFGVSAVDADADTSTVPTDLQGVWRQLDALTRELDRVKRGYAATADMHMGELKRSRKWESGVLATCSNEQNKRKREIQDQASELQRLRRQVTLQEQCLREVQLRFQQADTGRDPQTGEYAEPVFHPLANVGAMGPPSDSQIVALAYAMERAFPIRGDLADMCKLLRFKEAQMSTSHGVRRSPREAFKARGYSLDMWRDVAANRPVFWACYNYLLLRQPYSTLVAPGVVMGVLDYPNSKFVAPPLGRRMPWHGAPEGVYTGAPPPVRVLHVSGGSSDGGYLPMSPDWGAMAAVRHTGITPLLAGTELGSPPRPRTDSPGAPMGRKRPGVTKALRMPATRVKPAVCHTGRGKDATDGEEEEGEEGEYEEEDQASSDSDGEDAQEREQAALDAAKTRPSRRTKREQAEASEIEQAKLDEAVKNAEAFFTPGGEGESAHFARMNALKEGEMCAEDALSAIGEETRMLAPHAPAKTSFAGI